MRIVTTVTCYVIRRRRCDIAHDRGLVVRDEDEYVYEVWLVFEYRLQPDPDARELPAATVLTAQAAAGVTKRLQEAVAEVAADRTAGMAWHADRLSGAQAADFVFSLPATVETLAGAPLSAAAGQVGIPAPAVPFGTDVITAALLKPVLGPLETAVHVVEIVGTVIGLVTGLHLLVVTCVSHLAHDELSSALARAFQHILSQAEEQALEQPSAGAAAAATSHSPSVDSGTTVHHGPDLRGETSHRQPTVSGADPSSVGSGTVGGDISKSEASAETLELLQEAGDSAASHLARRAAKTEDQAADLRQAGGLGRLLRLTIFR